MLVVVPQHHANSHDCSSKDEPRKLSSLVRRHTGGRGLDANSHSQGGAESSWTGTGSCTGLGPLSTSVPAAPLINAATRPSIQRKMSRGRSLESPSMVLAAGSCSEAVVTSPAADVSSAMVHSAGISSLLSAATVESGDPGATAAGFLSCTAPLEQARQAIAGRNHRLRTDPPGR